MKSGRKIFRTILLILAGSILYSLSISLLLEPNSLAPGGVTGIVIILVRFLPLQVGTLVFILNIPLMILGIWKLGIRFLASTVLSVAMTSAFTNILSSFGPITREPILAAAAGGSLLALGVGITFKAGATTGGMDIVIKLIKLRYPHIKTGRLFLILDAVVITASAIVFRNVEIAMFAGIAVLISSFVLDTVLYGSDSAKLIYIISEKEAEIAEMFLKELDVGVTYLEGEGAFSGKEKQVLMCAMRKQLLPQAQSFVREIDANAFMIVTSATEIFGEGFKGHNSIRL